MGKIIIIIFLIVGSCCSNSRSTSENPNMHVDESENTDTIVDIHATDSIKSDSITESNVKKNIYYISLPYSGILMSVKKKNGDVIATGDLLAVFEHSEILKLKSEFLKAKHEFEYQKLTYSRVGELAIENATTLRKMELAARNYKIAEINFFTLQSMVRMLGVNPDNLSIASLNKKAYLFSSVNGKIIDTNIAIGKYYTEAEEIFYVVKGE